MEAPAPLEIRLLGGFHVAVRGRTVPPGAWRQRRAAAIVKLLALSPGHRLHREQLIEALWPDLEEEAAANNLRVAVHRARRRLEDAGAPPNRFLTRDGEELTLAPAGAARVDVDAFDAAVRQAWATDDPALSRQALDLYAGDLLPEDRYDDWASDRREALRASFLALLARLAQLHEGRGEPGPAIATWQRLLAVEPLDEPAHAALIRLYAQVGETHQATTQYQRLRELLQRELGAEPEETTRELMSAIRAGLTPQSAQPPATATAPPRAGDGDRAGDLPRPIDALIGREREVAELRRLLASHRLVTLTGPAGVGKTRLAIAVAEQGGELRSGDGDRDEVRFADLSPLRDPELVLPALARACGVREEEGTPLSEAVAARLGDAAALLVIDNFEQVVAAAPRVTELMTACPHLTVLITSRVRLRLRGEQEYPVPPLPVETEDARDPPPALRPPSSVPSPAVQLFVARAQESDPRFALDGGNQVAVTEICRRLDGLPLAIELAAARVRVFPPAALLEQLQHPLAVLTGGPRDAPARQQTLRAAIAWSHDLLTPDEQVLFRRLAAFAGGFTLEAVAAIGPISHPPSPIILDLVTSLVEQSLVRRLEGSEGAPRFGLLATIRDFAMERLREAGEERGVGLRHAAFYLALAERADRELTGPEAAAWLSELEREHDNLRAAMTSFSEQGESLEALRLAGALWWFWWQHGHLSEGRARLARALAEGAPAPAETRAKALDGAGVLAAAQGDLGEASAHHAEALRLWRECGDARGEIRALTNLAQVADAQGNPRRAAAYLREALPLARALGNRRSLAVVLANLGQVAMSLADYQHAASLLAESVALFREMGDQRNQSAILANLGALAFLMGDFVRAKEWNEEALVLLREAQDRQAEADVLLNLGHTVQRLGDLGRAGALLREARDRYEALGDRSGTAFALNHLGRLEHARGNDVDAETYLRQGLALGEEIGDQVAVVEALEGLALVAGAVGEAARAAQLMGAAEARRAAIGVPLPEVHRADYEETLVVTRRTLGEDGFASAWAAGQARSIAQLAGRPEAVTS